jgi:hypothetical protein
VQPLTAFSASLGLVVGLATGRRRDEAQALRPLDPEGDENIRRRAERGA